MLLDNMYSVLGMSPAEKVLMYILHNTDGNTKIFNRTYSQIQKDTEVSQVTISRVFEKLKSSGTLIPAGRSRWIVPAVMGYSDSPEGPGMYTVSHLNPSEHN